MMVLVVLLMVVVVLVLLRMVLFACWGSGYGSGSGLGLGTGSKCLKTASQRCGGIGRGRGGFLACCRVVGAARLALGGPPAALALAVAFWIGAAVRGQEEVEENEEDEDEERVVVLGDAGCARMRAGAALPAAAASSAATAGMIEAICSGSGFAAVGWKAPVQR